MCGWRTSGWMECCHVVCKLLHVTWNLTAKEHTPSRRMQQSCTVYVGFSPYYYTRIVQDVINLKMTDNTETVCCWWSISMLVFTLILMTIQLTTSYQSPALWIHVFCVHFHWNIYCLPTLAFAQSHPREPGAHPTYSLCIGGRVFSTSLPIGMCMLT